MAISAPPRIIIAGASGALGRVIARSLGARGARLGLTYHRNESAAAALASELPGSAVRRLDLTATADIPRVIDELASELGGIDGFVHAAGVGSTLTPPAYERVADTPEDGWDRLMAVHVRGAFFATQRLSMIMKGGNIVFVGSMNGVKSAPAPVPYATATGALRAMTTALGKELGPRNIRVVTVAAGLLEAGLSSLVPAELQAEYKKHSALKRLGKLEEIAELVAWLAACNTYITGRTIAVDGGL